MDKNINYDKKKTPLGGTLTFEGSTGTSRPQDRYHISNHYIAPESRPTILNPPFPAPEAPLLLFKEKMHF